MKALALFDPGLPLALGHTFTSVSLQLPADLTAQQWEQIGATLQRVDEVRQWWIGDWWNAGVKWGDGQRVCWELGLSYQATADCGMVSKHFQFSRRRENLTFTHHREVCGISDPSVQDFFLDWCEETIAETGKPRSRRLLRNAVQAYFLPDEAREALAARLSSDEQSTIWEEAVRVAPSIPIIDDHVPETTSNGTTNGVMPAANVKNLGYVGRQPGTPERDSDAWYTPAEYIALARATMGSIDLDPFSSTMANQLIGAARIFTAATSAFEHSWLSSPPAPLRVWMNPPYSVTILPKAVATFLDYWHDGKIDQALVLVNNCTETAWFKALREACVAVCFPTSRIAFVSPDGKPISGGTRGQTVFYYGTPLQAAHFGHTFQSVGWVIDKQKGWASYV